MGEVLTNGVYLPDRGERNAYDGLKGNWNTLDSIAGKAPGYDGHISDTDIHVTAADKQSWNGKADASHVHNANDVTTGVFDAARIPNLDASKITTGTIDIDRLPQGALERLVKVADQAARYALTTDDVQLGDTVQQLDTGVMYVVTDETKLDSADGYTEYTAGSATSVPWSGVTGKPADYTPASHSHGNITNDGKVGTAANKPLITGTDGVIQAGSFGNQANTFCEGNDSRLSDARTPVAHTHTKSDVIGLFNSANSWTENNTYAKYILMKNTTVEVGNAPSNNTSKEISFIDKNNETLSRLVGKAETSGNSYIFLHATNKYTNNALDPNGSARHSYFYVGLDATGKAYNKHAADTFPDVNNTYDLGSSSYQWNNLYAKKVNTQSVNGINPGALSILNKDNKADITSEFTDLTGGNNFYIPPADGFVSINADTEVYCAVVSSTHNTAFWRQSAVATTTGYASVTIPVRAGLHLLVKIKSTGAIYAEFFQCLGNV